MRDYLFYTRLSFEPHSRFPRREEVDRANSGRLSGLQTEAMTYTAQDGGPLALTDSGKKMLSNFMAPEVLTLRKDAQVGSLSINLDISFTLPY